MELSYYGTKKFDLICVGNICQTHFITIKIIH